jgi:microcystin-dependent protein
MKKINLLLICLILSAYNLIAQPGFSYQAILRNADGSLRANESVLLDVELIQDSVVVYSESHSVTTNDFGVFSIVVGEGAGEETYSPAIFLSNDSSYIPETYLKVSESGGNVLSETKLLGVPIADVARVALNVQVTFPVGAVTPFAGNPNKIPDGWLLCDGTVYNRTAYPELFNVIGYSWGTTGTDLFRVPDLRGVFLRGVSSNSSDGFVDPDKSTRISRYSGGNIGNNVGSYQTDEFENHTHTNKTTFIVDGAAGRYGGGSYGSFSQNPAINNTGGNETRPQNAYVYYIIKY